jgi:hypothetical protein
MWYHDDVVVGNDFGITLVVHEVCASHQQCGDATYQTNDPYMFQVLYHASLLLLPLILPTVNRDGGLPPIHKTVQKQRYTRNRHFLEPILKSRSGLYDNIQGQGTNLLPDHDNTPTVKCHLSVM